MKIGSTLRILGAILALAALAAVPALAAIQPCDQICSLGTRCGQLCTLNGQTITCRTYGICAGLSVAAPVARGTEPAAALPWLEKAAPAALAGRCLASPASPALSAPR